LDKQSKYYFNSNLRRDLDSNLKYDFQNVNTEEANINPMNKNINSNQINKIQKKSNSVAKKNKIEKEEQQNKDNHICSILQNHAKILKFYLGANREKKSIFECSLMYEAHIIIKEFIPHFANFNYEISEAMDLLIEISTRYNLPKENVSFYVTYLNSSIYTVKNKIAQKTKIGYEICKIKDQNDYKVDKNYILYNCIEFLDYKTILNVFSVSRNFYNKYNKKIISNVLENDYDNKINKNRINIWKSVLKIVKILL